NVFNIKVASSDNLSGVEAIRLYAVTPANNCAISGWLPSGITNQYYKEFLSSAVDYNFTAVCEGLYTFTLWVKDKAGNIAYEPHGPVTIGIDLPVPLPLPAVAPTAPSNLQLTISNQTVNLVWQDNANNEDGFKLYRNDQLLIVLPTNTVGYQDKSVEIGKLYTYRLYAFKGDLNSEAISGSITVTALPVGDYRYADCLRYPLACDKVYRIEPDSQIPTGACFDYQPFGSLFALIEKIHQGADLNFKGINDYGKPVYAIGNGLIWDFGWVSGWGNYLIMRIQSYPDNPFMLTDGTKVQEIYALYAHLAEIKIIKPDGQVIDKSSLVKKTTYLQLGWQLGTVGDADGLYSPHLHFEIRTNGYSQLGNGYWPVNDSAYLNYFVDPLEFVDNNKTLDDKTPMKIVIHGYDRQSTRQVFLDFDSSLWQRQGRIYEGFPLASVGWSNHLWLTSSANSTEASWNYSVPDDGAYSLYLILPRYYGQAKGVSYRIWHSNPQIANPSVIKLDQTNADQNRKVYLGTYDLYQGWRYSVDLQSQTADSPPVNVALDTLILEYEGDFGTGGGPIIPPDPLPDPVLIQTINTTGILTFRFAGTYTKPELHCYGAGLSWENIILQNGVMQNNVTVSYADTVYCNALLENGRWLAEKDGILPNQHLFVNDQEIIGTADNNLGGRNIVFNLLIKNTGDDNNPPEDDFPDDFSGTINVNVSGDVSGLGGCQINNSSAGQPARMANFLFLLLPAIILCLVKNLFWQRSG
ncbi:MAG: hypothetical protein A2Y67_02795, partial [Candidatus Buchananbacteria bacterium RBG_13_39_9]